MNISHVHITLLKFLNYFVFVCVFFDYYMYSECVITMYPRENNIFNRTGVTGECVFPNLDAESYEREIGDFNQRVTIPDIYLHI